MSQTRTQIELSCTTCIYSQGSAGVTCPKTYACSDENKLKLTAFERAIVFAEIAAHLRKQESQS